MDWEDYESPEEDEERRRDPKIDQAKDRVRTLLAENAASVYYIMQLQVLLEKEFFHWITGRAVGELVAEGAIGDEVAALSHGRARFVFDKSHRYRIRQITRAVQAIERYSAPEIARACGHWAETLFLLGLAERGFTVHGRNTNTWSGKTWTASNHNLDFVVSRDGVTYGAEVKNTWDYIPPEEMRVKLAIAGDQIVVYLAVRTEELHVRNHKKRRLRPDLRDSHLSAWPPGVSSGDSRCSWAQL